MPRMTSELFRTCEKRTKLHIQGKREPFRKNLQENQVISEFCDMSNKQCQKE